jgi:hypothetical protein
MGLLKLNDIKLGYCQNCENPVVVGVFELTHWKYNFLICSDCLKKLSSDIDQKGKAVFLKEVQNDKIRSNTSNR